LTLPFLVAHVLSPFFLENILHPSAQGQSVELPPASAWEEQGVVLSPSGSGWDSFAKDYFGATSMVRKAGTYYLYYHAASGPRRSDGGPANRAIGIAISQDGVHFTKYSGNPIITHQPSKGHINHEEEGASNPVVTLDGAGNFTMFWAAKTAVSATGISNDIHLSISKDGFNFSDKGLVIPHTIDGGGDEVLPNGVIRALGGSSSLKGSWHLWYTTDGFGGRKTSLATGDTPSQLKQHSNNPVLSMRHNWPVLHSNGDVSVLSKEGSTITLRKTTIHKLNTYSSSVTYSSGSLGFIFPDHPNNVWRWYYIPGPPLRVQLRAAPMTDGSPTSR